MRVAAAEMRVAAAEMRIAAAEQGIASALARSRKKRVGVESS